MKSIYSTNIMNPSRISDNDPEKSYMHSVMDNIATSTNAESTQMRSKYNKHLEYIYFCDHIRFHHKHKSKITETTNMHLWILNHSSLVTIATPINGKHKLINRKRQLYNQSTMRKPYGIRLRMIKSVGDQYKP